MSSKTRDRSTRRRMIWLKAKLPWLQIWCRSTRRWEVAGEPIEPMMTTGNLNPPILSTLRCLSATSVLSESPLPSFGAEGEHIDVTNIQELKRADSADYGQLD